VESPEYEIEIQGEQSAWISKPVEQRRREFGLAVATIGVLGAAAIGVLITGNSGTTEAIAAATVASAPTIAAPPTVVPIDVEFELTGLDDEGVDVDGELTRSDGGCTVEALSVRLGASGDGVACLQNALADVGYFAGTADGQFNDATLRAVMEYQTSEDLFVDGVVGRESAVALGIWPDEESLVTRTPPPAPGATDLWGVALGQWPARRL
jgi:peptidoglycan hydrolase-like protein with peptidoglycan-binding domain